MSFVAYQMDQNLRAQLLTYYCSLSTGPNTQSENSDLMQNTGCATIRVQPNSLVNYSVCGKAI